MSTILKRALGVAALIILALIVIFAQEKSTPLVDLRDFTDVEIRGAGITLSRDMKVRVVAVGGGDKSLLREWINDDSHSGMFAYGWIIDAATREVVWDMNRDNTSGRRDNREAEEEISLKKGSYEVYFTAWGYIKSGAFSYSSANIDRRDPNKRGRNVISIFGEDFGDMREAFMDKARDVWGISLFVNPKDADAAKTFTAPAPFRQTLLSITGVGDNATVRKTITTSRNIKVRIYALGEGRSRDEMSDHGWLVNSGTRRRVWDMTHGHLGRAGGSSKNKFSDVEVEIPKGSYELVYVTDGTHSAADWNDSPPFDPFSYGVTIFLDNESDRSAFKVEDGAPADKNIIVDLTHMRDDEFRSMAFSLKKETKVQVYCMGERSGHDRMADYGWIINARTREKVWVMDEGETEHAGGASKNRLSDVVLTLPKGDYVAYYQTDDSHDFGDWNSTAPYDPERWGLTIRGLGPEFDPKSVVVGKEPVMAGVIAEIVRVRDGRHERRTFVIEKTQRVRVYAVGEGMSDDMADYGWIEDKGSGRTVWEMTYGMTGRAGGARKNRMVNTVINLEPGEYVLHYRTDDTHAFNDWNSDPPDDPDLWGIRLTKEE